MKFGIHSLLFKETFVESDLPLLDRCRQMDFDAVEIIPFDPNAFPAAKVRQAASDLGLEVNTGYGLPAECNTISPDPAVRRAGVELSRQLVDLSAEAGARVFGGVIYCGWGYLTGRMRTIDEWKWGVESTRQVAEYAHQNAPGLILGIETLNRFESHFLNTVEDARRFIADVDMPNVMIHADTFHLIREENDVVDALDQCGSKLGYIHACENQRGIPGTGMVPWRGVFEALQRVGYDGTITVESFDPDMPNIAKLCCIWRRMAESPEQLATEGLRFLRQIHREVNSGTTAKR
jgi:D-psicose/D-tagatose/L-ribulose 3-epimerase